MAVRIKPIQIPAAAIRIDLHIKGAVRTAAIGNFSIAKPSQLLKKVMVFVKAIAIHEVDGKTAVDINRREDTE